MGKQELLRSTNISIGFFESIRTRQAYGVFNAQFERIDKDAEKRGRSGGERGKAKSVERQARPWFLVDHFAALLQFV
jgi:hypothetical protein